MDEIEACEEVLGCGHKCCGYAGETEHLPCLEDGCEGGGVANGSEEPVRKKFQSGSDECAICLDELKLGVCIQLECGHIWHFACLRDQLRVGQPNKARRLQFTGCCCGMCGQFCEHEKLRDILSVVSTLKTQVSAMALDQARVDQLAESTAVTTVGDAYYNKVLEYALHIYAFYLCSICENPYFGGTVTCGENNDDVDIPAAERLCPNCNDRGGVVCQDNTHQAFYVWKCRYCCSEAKLFCFGNVHFCTECHARSSTLPRGGKLEPKACPGRGQCTSAWPFPTGKNHHENGPGVQNEQLLHCAQCASTPTTAAHARNGDGTAGNSMESATERLMMDLHLRRSPNMVFNPDGALGTTGWFHQEDRFRPWSTEPIGGIPIHNCTTNFVSTFVWCNAVQLIDLGKFLHHPGQFKIEVTSRYTARTDCPSVYRMIVKVLVSRGPTLRVAKGYDTEVLSAPQDHWALAKIVTEPVANATHLVVEHYGKDEKFWRGWFGSKFTRCEARVLYEEDAVGFEAAVNEGGRQEGDGVASAAAQEVFENDILKLEAFRRVEDGDESMIETPPSLSRRRP